jgi:Ca2+-binding EF-hand superfamily protein
LEALTIFDRITTLVSTNAPETVLTTQLRSEYKEAFALFDKKGTGTVPRETLGDLLRALGQNPTQAEVAEIVASSPREGARRVPMGKT